MRNEKFSNRNLSCELRNKVLRINDSTTIIFWQTPLKRDFIDARIKFTSGPAIGKEYAITVNTASSITVPGWGGTVPEIGDKFYVFWDLTILNASNFNDTTIYNSCFAKEIYGTDVLPSDVSNVILEYCNIDNCNVPAGVTLALDSSGNDTCTNKRIEKQTDLMDWECDKATGNPIDPFAKKLREDLGISSDPADLPAEELDDSVLNIKQIEAYNLTLEG